MTAMIRTAWRASARSGRRRPGCRSGEQALLRVDESCAGQKADRGLRNATAGPFDDQAGARAEHHPGGQRIRAAEEAFAVKAPQREWERAEPGRQRGRGGGEKDDRVWFTGNSWTMS